MHFKTVLIMELPREKRKPINVRPKLMILFGKYKSGKSSICSNIDNNLIIDLEHGYDNLEAMVVNGNTMSEICDIKRALDEELKNNMGGKPYKYITIDNATRLEELSMEYAIKLYKNTPMGKNYEGTDLKTLPQGAGYMYIRQAINNIINWFIPCCDTLILVAHTKAKQIRINSEEMDEMSVDLFGKTGDLLCGLSDAVGYVFRRDNQTIISFKAGDNIIKGARPSYLTNKEFVAIESDENNVLTYPQLNEVFI